MVYQEIIDEARALLPPPTDCLLNEQVVRINRPMTIDEIQEFDKCLPLPEVFEQYYDVRFRKEADNGINLGWEFIQIDNLHNPLH